VENPPGPVPDLANACAKRTCKAALLSQDYHRPSCRAHQLEPPNTQKPNEKKRTDRVFEDQHNYTKLGMSLGGSVTVDSASMAEEKHERQVHRKKQNTRIKQQSMNKTNNRDKTRG
jgi:predicted kinase